MAGTAALLPTDLFGFVDPEPPRSLYAYAPVYRVRDAKGDWVVKRTSNAHSSASAITSWLASLHEAGVATVASAACFAPNPRLGFNQDWWVVYPFVEGSRYTGGADQIADSGRLLARIHAVVPKVEHGLGSIASSPIRQANWLRRHADAASPSMRAAGVDPTRFHQTPARRAHEIAPSCKLPMTAGCCDFTASNLVFTPRPVFVDPDHAAYLPGMLDLAVAVLLFHNDAPDGPHRMLTGDEWQLFLDAYRSIVDLTDDEIAAWPSVLRGLARSRRMVAQQFSRRLEQRCRSVLPRRPGDVRFAMVCDRVTACRGVARGG